MADSQIETLRTAANWELVCKACGDITFCKELEHRCGSCGSSDVSVNELRGE